MKHLLTTLEGRGSGFSAVLAAIGTGLNVWLGGFDNMVQALVAFMAVDFLLGFLAAGKAGKIDSHIMFWGGVNKLLVLVMVGVGVILDGLIGTNEPYIRTAVIWFYIGREGLSVVENYGKMDLPLPKFIKTALEQLKQRGDDGEAR
jgi:toxin secretion/phage lysis holin